jgi:uncharacterized protein (TIGR04255 family)
MVTSTHLEKAPIVEALIDIRVKLPSEVDIIKLESMGGLISRQYPKKKKRIRFEGKIDFKEGKLPEHEDTSQIDGYIYASEDERYIVQTRLDGFTVSRLKPYETWENLRDEAYRLWEIYVKTVSPEIITRVALRYINRLELPLSMGDLDEYLTSPPIIPKNLPQEICSFLTRVVIPEESIGAFAIITRAFESVVNNIVPIILDIDVFKKSEFEVDKKDAWEVIDTLREFKNKIFFEFITEKTKELYK